MAFGISRPPMAAFGLSVALCFVAAAPPHAGEAASPPTAAAQTQDRQARPGDVGPGLRIERRLGYLHERLEIRPSQEEAWGGFAAVVRGEAQAIREQGALALQDFEARRGPPPAIEGLERRQRMLRTLLESTGRILGALRPLYDALDGNQKRVADQLLLRAGVLGGPGGTVPFLGLGGRGGDFGTGAPPWLDVGPR